MQKSWPLARWLKAGAMLVAAAASIGAWAQGAPAVVLGQALNFSVQLRSEGGEAITPQCIFAEVTAGERKLPPAQVRTALESLGPDGARIRVTTTQRIDDPVVSVQLTLGCQARVTRRYMLLAEPAAQATDTSTTQPAATRGAAAIAPDTPAARAARLQPDQAAGRRPPAAEATPSAKAKQPATPRQPPAGPRLRLDAPEPVLSAESEAVEQAIEVVAQAATALRAAMAAASAAEQRVKALERSVEQARSDASAQRQIVATLQAQAAERADASPWLWPLLLALVAAIALAATLAWRLWRRPRARVPMPEWHESPESAFDEQQQGHGASRSATSPTPFVASDLVLPSGAAAGSPAPRPAVPVRADASLEHIRGQAFDAPALPPSPPLQRTAAGSDATSNREGQPRDVSIEELIDLEQQAEFFVVLGQDAAAIDLLVEHLRLTGGGSPLPYLKLLDIYRRLGDQAAYERTRSRFNERFNAYAPAWGEGALLGRGLEDYPGVVPRLCQVWARPLDAMAELEALLFRKSRGDLFELPAYREVLFLYALARDLFDRESTDAVSVDLLLPLHEHDDPYSTRPAPFDDSIREPTDVDDEPGGRPTMPVDLDLSGPDRPSSIFDPVDSGFRNSRR